MSEDLVEAVARAIRDADVSQTGMGAALPAEYQVFARAALAAVEASGWVIVPKVPTPEMIAHAGGFRRGEDIYAAFLSARMAIVEAAQIIQWAVTAPHVLFKPTLEPDGTKWCALYGADLMVGVSGFGDTPEGAMSAFDEAWRKQKTPAAMLSARPKQEDGT